jgi:hypothetical protein
MINGLFSQSRMDLRRDCGTITSSRCAHHPLMAKLPAVQMPPPRGSGMLATDADPLSKPIISSQRLRRSVFVKL